MKKILILFYVALLSIGVNAHERNDSTFEYYMEVHLNSSITNVFPIQVFLEGSSSDRFYDENGQKMKFSVISEMLNYLSKQGWTFVATLRMTSLSEPILFFKKTAKTPEDAKKGLYFKSDFKK